jgi:hypothetical protein
MRNPTSITATEKKIHVESSLSIEAEFWQSLDKEFLRAN